MKIVLLAVLFVALVCWRCNDDDERVKAYVKAEVAVTGEGKTLSVPANGGEYVLEIDADQRWSVGSSKGWCKVTRDLENNKVTVRVTRSGSLEDRTAVVTVSAGTEAAATIEVTQAAMSGKDAPLEYEGYTLAWSDEFNAEGDVNASEWSFENGFLRNEELQWYRAENTQCKDGFLVITGEKANFPNPNYEAGSSDWKKNRENVEYTSSSIVSKYRFRKGRMEVRAKIPTATGAWPAIWTTGVSNDSWCWEWPLGGEIDLLEYYLVGGVPSIHANVCWASDTRWSGKWQSYNRPLADFVTQNTDWTEEFHIWRMDWDDDYMTLYLDDEVMNRIDLQNTNNGTGGLSDWWRGSWRNPFTDAGNSGENFGQQIFLNLAIGGNGGTPDDAAFPLKYLVDYVRVYQKTE